ncbi:MAG: peptidylprolyl isomerase, partial [Candidatus Cloacimonas sp.]|nr:peptidylprolyl isomerase [Candidatus Cloacimonadota bacterium]
MIKILAVIIVTILSITCYADADKDVKIVKFETNYGDIELELYPQVAPKLVANFIKLSNEQFYDETYFHRVIPDFMIQGGDPNTRDGDRASAGTGGPSYRLDDEISAKALGLDKTLVKDSYMARQVPPNHPAANISLQKLFEEQGYNFKNDLPSIPNTYGALSMANAGPNTNGSQFFIITAKEGTPWLDGKHTVIGKVVKGMDVVHKIENL